MLLCGVNVHSSVDKIKYVFSEQAHDYRNISILHLIFFMILILDDFLFYIFLRCYLWHYKRGLLTSKKKKNSKTVNLCMNVIKILFVFKVSH